MVERREEKKSVKKESSPYRPDTDKTKGRGGLVTPTI